MKPSNNVLPWKAQLRDLIREHGVIRRIQDAPADTVFTREVLAAMIGVGADVFTGRDVERLNTAWVWLGKYEKILDGLLEPLGIVLARPANTDAKGNERPMGEGRPCIKLVGERATAWRVELLVRKHQRTDAVQTAFFKRVLRRSATWLPNATPRQLARFRRLVELDEERRSFQRRDTSGFFDDLYDGGLPSLPFLPHAEPEAPARKRRGRPPGRGSGRPRGRPPSNKAAQRSAST